MELRKRLMAIVGITALMMSMTAGMASAQATDTAGASVILNCAAPMTVELSGDIDFGTVNLIAENGATGGTLGLTVNMGCYWGPWSVDASITNFTAPVFGGVFSASHFSLLDPDVTSYFLNPLDGPFNICEPDANAGIFDGSGDGGTILETSESLVTWLLCPPLVIDTHAAAPFTTTATYTPTLSGLSPFLPSGTYTATLTVDLAGE